MYQSSKLNFYNNEKTQRGKSQVTKQSPYNQLVRKSTSIYQSYPNPLSHSVRESFSPLCVYPLSRVKEEEKKKKLKQNEIQFGVLVDTPLSPPRYTHMYVTKKGAARERERDGHPAVRQRSQRRIEPIGFSVGCAN